MQGCCAVAGRAAQWLDLGVINYSVLCIMRHVTSCSHAFDILCKIHGLLCIMYYASLTSYLPPKLRPLVACLTDRRSLRDAAARDGG